MREAERTQRIGNIAKIISIAEMNRRTPVLNLLCPLAEILSRRRGFKLDIFTDLFPHSGIAELEEGEGANDEKDDDGDR